MRASTLVFLGIFGAFVWLHHERHDHHEFASAIRAIASGETPLRVDTRASNSRVRKLEQEHEGLAQRCRDLDRSLTAVAQSVRALREIAERHANATVRAGLEEIEAGQRKLVELKERTDVERVAALARLQLARAGVDDTAPLPTSAAPDGPLEALALEQIEIERAPISSRAR